jgi:hypothetical protein
MKAKAAKNPEICRGLKKRLQHNSDQTRIERYLAVALEPEARPVILLTKVDIYQGNLDHLLSDVQGRFNCSAMGKVWPMCAARNMDVSQLYER